MFELVLGSHNAKKLAELRSLLEPLEVRIISLAQIGEAIEVEETGHHFKENARLKATVQARHLGRWVLAEDSGLSVDALGGRPGVYSARYSGPAATAESNNQKLLEEMQGIPPESRAANYTCELCLSNPGGVVTMEAAGHCRGKIAIAPAGAYGFGYDPLFLIPEYHRTLAQLGPRTKEAISHRSRAIRAFLRAWPARMWPD